MISRSSAALFSQNYRTAAVMEASQRCNAASELSLRATFGGPNPFKVAPCIRAHHPDLALESSCAPL
eukprot:1372120-Pleurochrysis_carterae.AAC.2